MTVIEIQRKISRAGIMLACANHDSKIRLLKILSAYCDILNKTQAAINDQGNKTTRI